MDRLRVCIYLSSGISEMSGEQPALLFAPSHTTPFAMSAHASLEDYKGANHDIHMLSSF